MIITRGVLYLAALIPPLLFAAISPARGQSPLDEKLAAVEKAIDARRKELNIPGISLVIVKDDRVIFMKGLGERDMDKKLPVTSDTLFAIGSSTKAFTAATVLMSVDDGRLNLADNPRNYLPYFRLRDWEADSKITIADLLSHRSGLPRTDLAWYTGRLNSRQVIEVAGTAKATARLGERFQYQNVMYLAAGEIVARVNRTTWPAFVKRRIFAPLGMTASNLNVGEMQKTVDYALGYVYDGAAKKHNHLPMRPLDAIAPAGAINSNARDMGQWVRLMLGGGRFNGKRLISERAFAEFAKPRITIGGPVHYGLGWMLRSWKEHSVLEHGGNIDGFNAQVALMPDQKLGFALLTNVSASTLGTFAMTTIWEELVGPKDPAPGAAAAETPISPEKEAGNYLLKAANMRMEVTFKDGRLTLIAPGQPPYPLENLGGRRYKLGDPAPNGFYITFRSRSGAPDKTEAFLEQPQGNAVLEREDAVPFTADISVEELMAKHIVALGGEAALRKHRSLLLKYDSVYEQQGVTGTGEIVRTAPSNYFEAETLFGAGRKVAFTRDYCDGKASGIEMSFTQPAIRSAAGLTDSILAADFYAPLNWKKLYKTVSIKGEDYVGGEKVYVVELIPEKGTARKELISRTSFLLLKREGPGPITELFGDYRNVDGVMIAFKRIRTSPLTGEGTVVIKEARFGARFPDSAFRPGEPPQKAQNRPPIERMDPFG